jgi:hypothetical protein
MKIFLHAHTNNKHSISLGVFFSFSTRTAFPGSVLLTSLEFALQTHTHFQPGVSGR